MEQRGSVESFAPVEDGRALAVILGSYPSPKSFEYGINYGHSQNRFWPLVAALAGCEAPLEAAARRRLITQNGLALWDVVRRCRILGASDASIADVEPNDVAALLRRTGARQVFCNGAAAFKLYQTHCEAHTGIKAVKLPSTSPANAAFGMQRLLEAWQPVGRVIQAYRLGASGGAFSHME